MDELEALKRFIAEGGKCWVCGDTGIAGQTLQHPDGELCECFPEYSAEYILEHWVEQLKRHEESQQNSEESQNIFLEF